MLYEIYYWVNDYYFEIVIIACIISLVLYALYRKLYNLKGSWSQKIDYEEAIYFYLFNGRRSACLRTTGSDLCTIHV